MMFLPFHGTFFFIRGVMAGSLGNGFCVVFVGVENLASPFRAGFVLVGVMGAVSSLTGVSVAERPPGEPG
jgi:hypothetical protein